MTSLWNYYITPLKKSIFSKSPVLAKYSCFSQTTSKLPSKRFEKLTENNTWCGLQRVRGPQADRRLWRKAVLGQGMAGWVSPGTIPPVSACLKSFAWLIRDDRTAAPNLQSAVTRGQCRRQSMGAAHCTGPDTRRPHASAFSSVLHAKSDTSHSFQPGNRQEMMCCWI